MVKQIGISGTREGMTGAQITWLTSALASQDEPVWLHHGCCVGVDEEAHWLAFEIGAGRVGHPPTDARLQMDMSDAEIKFDQVRWAKPYLDRNREIVKETSELWAFPASRRQEGGTWYTINYAKSIGRPVTIVHRDGTVEH